MKEERKIRWGWPGILFIIVELVCWSGFMHASGQANRREFVSANVTRSTNSTIICLKHFTEKECNARDVQHGERARAIAALDAQENATRWAWWSALLAALQIPISLAGILAVVMTIKQGQRTLLQDREFAESDLRPWLRLSASIIHGRVSGDFITADISIRLTNVGRTVAANVQTFRCSKSYGIEDFQTALGQIRKPPKKQSTNDGFPILPGDDETVTMLYELNIKDICFSETHLGRIAIVTIAVWCDYEWGNNKPGRMLRLYQLGIMLEGNRHMGIPEKFIKDGDIDLAMELQHGSEVE